MSVLRGEYLLIPYSKVINLATNTSVTPPITTVTFFDKNEAQDPVPQLIKQPEEKEHDKENQNLSSISRMSTEEHLKTARMARIIESTTNEEVSPFYQTMREYDVDKRAIREQEMREQDMLHIREAREAREKNTTTKKERKRYVKYIFPSLPSPKCTPGDDLYEAFISNPPTNFQRSEE